MIGPNVLFAAIWEKLMSKLKAHHSFDEATMQKLDLRLYQFKFFNNLRFYWIYREMYDLKSERSCAFWGDFIINLLPNCRSFTSLYMIEIHFLHWEVHVCYLRYSNSHYKQCNVFILGERSLTKSQHVVNVQTSNMHLQILNITLNW